MKRDFEVMGQIQSQKAKDIEKSPAKKLDSEGKVIAECKRQTFDIVDTPVDPLR